MRIKCLGCHRTSKRKHEDDNEVVCVTCWRTVPTTLKARYRQLNRREIRMLRIVERRIELGTIDHATVIHAQGIIERARLRNWKDIHDFFLPTDRPAGLDLNVIGL